MGSKYEITDTFLQNFHFKINKIQYQKRNLFSYLVSGDIYYRIHVFGVVETVPKAHKAKRKEVTVVCLEKMVHANPFCSQVTAINLKFLSF